MLESRPLLLSPETRLTIQLSPPAGLVKIIIDGRHAWDMSPRDCLVMEAASRPLLLLGSPSKDYFAILRNKLNWGGRDSSLPLPYQVTGTRGQATGDNGYDTHPTEPPPVTCHL